MANKETGFGTIKCPRCGEAIPVSEAIHHQIAERTRQEFRAEALEGKRLLAARERQLNEKAAALDQTISERLTAERVNISKELEAKLRSGLSTEMADLKRQADERSEQLARAQAIELELRTEKRSLEEREKARDLEMARKLDEERVRLQQEISTRLEEEHARQVAEKDKRLSDAMKANDELRRKLQQGSQQLQGEVLELALEELISQTFPSDLIQPVPKGINGADILQRVQNPNGDLAGSIIWESKRTKAWSEGWIQKIKDDQRQAKADIAIIVSDALPKDCTHFKQMSGIWVTHPRCAVHLASALRLLLFEVASAKRAAVGKNEKMEILYAYLSGIEFRQRVDSIAGNIRPSSAYVGANGFGIGKAVADPESKSSSADIEEDDAEDQELEGGQVEAELPAGSFYWRQSRENLFSPAGIRIFQLAYANKDKPYEEARKAIDAEYEKLSPRLQTRGGAKKHGGIFATYMTLLEEMGLMHRTDVSGVIYLQSTPAGDQANTLLNELPQVLRIVPYFVLELLSRYRFNNPYNKSPKNAALASAIEESDILSSLREAP